MKISFDDDNDLKPLEDMLARALVRAAKTVLRDLPGLLQALQASTPAPEPPEAPQAPQEPVNGFGHYMERPAPPPPAADRRKTRHTLAGKLKCVPDRPDGYYTRDEAADWLRKQGMNFPDPSLSKWLLDGSVAAVIVTESSLKPTKGLPGRLYVKREDVKARNRLRIQNMPPRWQGQHGAPVH